MKTGGRTAIVTPYSAGKKVCSGQYAQFQMLDGLGGQIDKALYVGDSVEKVSMGLPGVQISVDCTDTIEQPEKGLAIRERGRWYVVKLGQGSSSSSFILGSIVGGNVDPTLPKVDANPANTDNTLDEQGYKISTDYPSLKPYSFTLPYLLNGQLKTKPRVKDWTKFNLPVTYKLGDTVPRTSDGLCYVKLERPHAFGDSSWDAAFPIEAVSDSPSGELKIDSARVSFTVFSRITIQWSNNFTEVSHSNPGAFYIITLTSKSTGYTPIAAVVTSVATWDTEYRRQTIYLSRELDPDKETAELKVMANAVNTNRVCSIAVTYSGDRFTIVKAINRNGVQSFVYGDYVLMKSTPVNMTDELGVTEAVLDIVGPVGPVVPWHAHINQGGGPYGGGRAYTSIAQIGNP
jgi:hypothetical protein